MWVRLCGPMPPGTTSVDYWVLLSRIADIVSVVGFPLAIAGLIWTIWGVLKARSAAEAAQTAAEAAQSRLLRVDAISGVAAVIATLEDLKRLHRAGAWDGMPERYASQRRALIAIRASNPKLTDPQAATLQGSISQLSGMEKQIERYLAQPDGEAPSAAKLNALLSRGADNLTQLLGELRIDDGNDDQ